MDDRLITNGAVTLAVAAITVAVYYFVRFRLAKRDTRKTARERDFERQLREESERRESVTSQRLAAVNGHVETILEGTPYKAPSRMWRLKGFGWLVGLVTGATTAARVAPAPGGTAATAVSAKVATLAGCLVVAVAAGGITYAVNVIHLPPADRPRTAVTAPAPPKVPRHQSLPAPSAPATTPAETPVASTGTTPDATTAAPSTTVAPATTTTTRATPTTQPTTTVTTTTTTTTPVAAPTDPVAEATTTAVPTVPPVDPAPGVAGNGSGHGKGRKPPRDTAPHVLCSGLPLLSELLGPCL